MTQTIGKFEILEELGHGAMGTVYRARDPVLDRQVALKTISPGLLTHSDVRVRFEREARAVARLTHPHIVTIYELGDAGGRLYIAMELIEGQDLAEAMVPPDRLSVHDKLRVIVAVCEGLDFAHKQGILHRDVKPANVRITRDLDVKLVDFGIARFQNSSMTMSGTILGTPSYIAPEVLLGTRVDHRADMWSVGVMLYELLAGERPFEAPTIASLVYRVVHEPPPLVDARRLGLPPAITAVVERALAKSPGGRFRDLADMAAALQKIMGVPVTRPPLSEQARADLLHTHLEGARLAASAQDFERTLHGVRRALALDPGHADALGLLEEAEARLREASAAQPAVLDLPPLGASDEFRTSVTGTALGAELSGRRPTTSQVLAQLKLKGASVFVELGTFGEPPATQSACLSPRGDWLAVSGVDGAIRFWDLNARRRPLTLRTVLHQRTGHDAMALALAFSPDGALLASGHVDGAVHLWDVERGTEIDVRLRHDDMATAVAFAPDGTVLASGGMDAALKLWDVRAARDGEARRELYRQPAGVTALCYTRAGSGIVTGHANRALRLLDAATGRLVASLWGPEGRINLLALHPDGRHVAVGSQDRTLRLYDVESRGQAVCLPAQRRSTTALGFFPGGQHLATVAQENAVQLWDLQTASPSAALWGQQEEIFTGLAIYAGGDHLAAALSDGRIRLWGPAV